MKLLRVGDVAERVGVVKSTVWKMVLSDPSFPQPVKVAPKVTGFLESEVDAWIEKKAAERPGALLLQKLAKLANDDVLRTGRA